MNELTRLATASNILHVIYQSRVTAVVLFLFDLVTGVVLLVLALFLSARTGIYQVSILLLTLNLLYREMHFHSL